MGIVTARIEPHDWVGVARLLRQDGHGSEQFVRWHEEHARGEREILVGRREHEVAGFLTVLRAPTHPAAAGVGAQFEHVYVAMAARGQGLGGQLLRAGEALVVQRGLALVGLSVPAIVDPALIRLLRTQGYRPAVDFDGSAELGAEVWWQKDLLPWPCPVFSPAA